MIVYPHYFADPFVLKHEGEYYAYGTPAGAGEGVQVLHSRDLFSWEPRGIALSGEDHLWAPEVARHEGRFYLYCSAGGSEGEGHRLRVAVSESPLGPFVPGNFLAEPFSIDASPFQDADGSWYLFYCVDFLEGERVGTGIVVDRLVTMDRLAGDPRVVVRAHAEWQVFQRHRHWYDRLWDAWYTVEGPFCLKRGDKYYLLYSGGSWKAANYGLTWAVANHPLGPYLPCEAEGPTLLETDAERVGPGHACVVDDYLVYHAWDPALTARTMRVARLAWDPLRVIPCQGNGRPSRTAPDA